MEFIIPIIGIILFVAGLLFAPRVGVLHIFRARRRKNKRIILEDALKHIHHCEQRSVPCSVESLAGAIAVSTDIATSLLSELESRSLISWRKDEFHLSSAGVKYAREVIRIHRLWERFLADETTVNERDWHERAERAEHFLSKEEADTLSARLGFPRFDPHGDPIPAATGELPVQHDTNLAQLREGDSASVTHIEDEPRSRYTEILDAGISPGSRLRVTQMTDTTVEITVDGRPSALSRNSALNVTVSSRVREKKLLPPSSKRLSDLRIGETATVAYLGDHLRGSQRRRLMDMGLLPGTLVTAELKSPGGDPIAYNIRGALIALRRQQAELIFLQ